MTNKVQNATTLPVSAPFNSPEKKRFVESCDRNAGCHHVYVEITKEVDVSL